MYLVAACLPTLRPLVSHFAPPWLKLLMRGKKSTSSASTPSIRLMHPNAKGGFTKLDGRHGTRDSGRHAENLGLKNKTKTLGSEIKVKAGGEHSGGVEPPSSGIGLTTNVAVEVEDVDLDLDLESGQRRKGQDIF